MLSRRKLLGGATAGVLGVFYLSQKSTAAATGKFPVTHTDDEWRKILTPDQFEVLRQEGTERPGTSALLTEHRKGNFACAGCEQEVFSSTTKFESGTGWPSFWAPLDGRVGTTSDKSFGMERTEVHCSRCGGHLGHVFNDGPKPTGLRYCLNGVALKFHPASA